MNELQERFNFKTLGKKYGQRYDLIYVALNGYRWHIMSSHKRTEITGLWQKLDKLKNRLEIK